MTHPGGGSGTGPGGGSGTGPGRDLDIERHHTGIGEPNEHNRPASTLPTVGMLVRDGERLGAQLLAMLNRDLDPASLPPEGLDFFALESLREVAGYHAEQVLMYLARIAALPLPPVGSAIKLPARREAAPSAAPVAEGRPGGPPVPGAGAALPFGYFGPVVER